MATKITETTIKQMQELYAKYGTYVAVAKELGVSASTVSKYLKQIKQQVIISTYEGPRPVANPNYPIMPNFLLLTPVEKVSYEKIVEELNQIK